MQRRFLDYLIITLKGIAMGAADAVPGVSGGTIAFISGIYNELVNTISNINIDLFKTLKNKGFKAFWQQLNGNFLLALLSGIIISFIIFMNLAKYLLENHPVLIWSYFFGLIIASILFVGKQITVWNVKSVSSLLLGAFLAYYITTLPLLAANTNPFFLSIAGAIAICAMILPGISGSFILVILGAYKTLSDAIHDFDFKRLGLFALGALIGILSFSHILKWLFKHYKNLTIALLTGFIIGSLNKVWPWKQTLDVLETQTGLLFPLSHITPTGTLSVYQKSINNFETFITISDRSLLPQTYAEINNVSAQLLPAIILMLAGFLTIFILEKVGSKN